MARMTPLRRRLIDDMTVRNLSPATQQSYVYAVAKFSRFFGRSPDQLGVEEVRAYQIHLVGQGLSWSHINQVSCALRFFFGVTLGRQAAIDHIVRAREPRKLPMPVGAVTGVESDPGHGRSSDSSLAGVSRELAPFGRACNSSWKSCSAAIRAINRATARSACGWRLPPFSACLACAVPRRGRVRQAGVNSSRVGGGHGSGGPAGCAGIPPGDRARPGGWKSERIVLGSGP